MPSTDGLLERLRRARSRADALAAVGHALADGGLGAHDARRAVGALLRNRTDALPWPATAGAREALSALDARLDRTLADGIRDAGDDTLAVVADELARCEADPARAARSLDLAFRALGPPASRSTARLVDLLRSERLPRGPVRSAVYRCLVDHGADVRGPLADDARIAPDARTSVLARQAARVADAGRARSVRFQPDPLRALGLALADWTAHATHPRQLFHAYYVAASLDAPDARREALAPLSRYLLPPEALAELDHQLAGAPVELAARALGAGRYECARCGAPRVRATGVRALDPDDPLAGAETRFECGACAMAYFAAWEAGSLEGGEPPVPRGWA